LSKKRLVSAIPSAFMLGHTNFYFRLAGGLVKILCRVEGKKKKKKVRVPTFFVPRLKKKFRWQKRKKKKKVRLQIIIFFRLKI
jgi:hypothetical protein